MSVHVRHPHGDGDKAVCGVRISERPERSFAETPAALVTAEMPCEGCYFRVLRTWQQIDPDFEPDPYTWTIWPWEDPKYSNLLKETS